MSSHNTQMWAVQLLGEHRVVSNKTVRTVWFLSGIRPTDPNRTNNQTHTCFSSNLFGNKAPMQSLHGITQTYKHTHTHTQKCFLYVTRDSCFIYLSHSSITMRNCHILFHSETPCYWFLCTRNKATSVLCNASRRVTAKTESNTPVLLHQLCKHSEKAPHAFKVNTPFFFILHNSDHAHLRYITNHIFLLVRCSDM